MKILITGGSGFIGHRLVAHLKVNHTITVLSRHPTLAYQLLGHDIHVIDSLSKLNDLNDFDAIINLAGESIANKRWSKVQKRRLCQSRWQLTEQLVALIGQSSRPPQVLINASAIGWYGEQDATPVDELCQTPNDEFTHQLCARWESIAQQASTQTRVCIVRIGLVLGKDGGALAKMLPVYRLGLGGPMGSGQQIVSWIHVQDLVRVFLFLLEHPACQGVFNGTAPNPVSNRLFSQQLAKAVAKPHFLTLPAPVLTLLMGEGSRLLLTGQHVMPNALQQAGFHFNYPILEQALSDLIPNY